MAPRRKPRPKPGPKAKKKRTPKLEVRRRVEEIAQIRLDGAEFLDVRNYASEKDWKLSDSQLWRYVQKADRLIRQSCEMSRKRLLKRHLAQRRRLYARAVESGDWRSALAALRDEAELCDL